MCSLLPLSSVWLGVLSRSPSEGVWGWLQLSLRPGGPFWGVLEGVDRGVEEGVLAVEVGGVVLLSLLSSAGPRPFSRGLPLSRSSLAPLALAFLNSTEVRRPTPPVVGRGGAPPSCRPLVAAAASLCKVLGGEGGRADALVQLAVSAAVAAWAGGPSSLRRLQGQPGDGLSPVMGRRVGGSSGASPGRGGGAGPVGSSVGGEVDLRSSGRGREKETATVSVAAPSSSYQWPFSM